MVKYQHVLLLLLVTFVFVAGIVFHFRHKTSQNAFNEFTIDTPSTSTPISDGKPDHPQPPPPPTTPIPDPQTTDTDQPTTITPISDGKPQQSPDTPPPQPPIDEGDDYFDSTISQVIEMSKASFDNLEIDTGIKMKFNIAEDFNVVELSLKNHRFKYLRVYLYNAPLEPNTHIDYRAITMTTIELDSERKPGHVVINGEEIPINDLMPRSLRISQKFNNKLSNSQYFIKISGLKREIKKLNSHDRIHGMYIFNPHSPTFVDVK